MPRFEAFTTGNIWVAIFIVVPCILILSKSFYFTNACTMCVCVCIVHKVK